MLVNLNVSHIAHHLNDLLLVSAISMSSFYHGYIYSTDFPTKSDFAVSHAICMLNINKWIKWLQKQ